MSVAFGVQPDTLVATPDGDRAADSLQAGDTVWSWDLAGGTKVARVIKRVHHTAEQHLVAIKAPPLTLRGCTPGMGVYDVFEELFRAAGSLSTLSQVQGFEATPEVDELSERTEPTTVVQLTLEGDEGCWFADGVLVRHLAED